MVKDVQASQKSNSRLLKTICYSWPTKDWYHFYPENCYSLIRKINQTNQVDNLQKKNYTQLINIGEDVSVVSSLENINYNNYRRPCFPHNVESVLVRMQRNRHFHIVLLATWISNMSLWSQSGNIYYGLKCTCPLAQHSHFWEFMPVNLYRYRPVYCSKWYSGKKTENNWMFIDRGIVK